MLAALIFFGARSLSGAAEPIGPVDGFNYVFGTQSFDASYQFTGQTRLLETAEAMRKLGATVIKFGLTPWIMRRQRARVTNGAAMLPKANPAIHTLTELARDEPSQFARVLDMPFANFVIWAHTFATGADGWRNGFSECGAAKGVSGSL